jgi:hypothetical protein
MSSALVHIIQFKKKRVFEIPGQHIVVNRELRACALVLADKFWNVSTLEYSQWKSHNTEYLEEGLPVTAAAHSPGAGA